MTHEVAVYPTKNKDTSTENSTAHKMRGSQDE